MQLYWHTTAPSYADLQTIPENRVYVSPDRADRFIRSFLLFSGGTVAGDDPKAPGVEIGRPGYTYRRVRLASTFGSVAVLVTDGHLPYPYGWELTGYETADLDATLAKAKSAGAHVPLDQFRVRVAVEAAVAERRRERDDRPFEHHRSHAEHSHPSSNRG
jgi:hypothetical protein